MNRSSPRSTTTMPTCPSALGRTTTISFVSGNSRISAMKAPSRATATSVDAHQELRAAHTHHARGGAHPHGPGGLLDHLARHHGERAFLERGVEFAFVRGAVEAVAIDLEHGRRPGRDHGVIEEGHADGAVGARHQLVGSAHVHARRGGDAFAVALHVNRAFRRLDLPYVLRIGGKPEHRRSHREYPTHETSPLGSRYGQIL